MSDTLEKNLFRMKSRIVEACERSRRDPESVHLLAVTKSVPTETIRGLSAQGMRDFGENRLQVAGPKLDELHEGLPNPTRWHFIGHIQTNKAAKIARLFSVIHSVDSVSLAARLGRARRSENLPDLDIFLQANVAGESQKSGLPLENVADAARQLKDLDGIRLIGLMTMAPKSEDPQEARPYFQRLRVELERLREQDIVGSSCRELSMGMSEDLEVAVEEGATWVRVGSALFDGLDADR